MPILGERLTANGGSLPVFPMNRLPRLVRSISFSDLSIANALVSLPGPLVSCNSDTPGRSRFIMSKPFNGSTARMRTAPATPGGCVVTFKQ